LPQGNGSKLPPPFLDTRTISKRYNETNPTQSEQVMEYAKVETKFGALYHECDGLKGDGVKRGYGRAIDEICKEPGDVWTAGGYEYASPIKFCPFCGLKLPD
jgi:hypothetical protein